MSGFRVLGSMLLGLGFRATRFRAEFLGRRGLGL